MVSPERQNNQHKTNRETWCHLLWIENGSLIYVGKCLCFLNALHLCISAVLLLIQWEREQAFSPFVVMEGTPSCGVCCRKGEGPSMGSCLTLGNELSEETHVLTKQETLLGKGAQVESGRVREPRRTALPCGSQAQILW